MSDPSKCRFYRVIGPALVVIMAWCSSTAPSVLAAQAPDGGPQITPQTGSLVFIPLITRPETNLPAAPSWGSARPLTDSTIELDWNDNSSNEQGFWIFCSGLASPVTVGANLETTILSGLAASTTYNCRIASFNQVGSLMAPDLVSAKTYAPADAPFAPNWLKAVTLSTTSIQLTWHNNSLGTSVTTCIQQSKNSGPFTNLACRPNSTTNDAYTDTGLTPATNYRYRAYTKPGTYSNTASANTFAAVPPLAPSLLQSSLLDSTTVRLTWQDNSTDEIDFHIEEKTGNGSYADIGSVGAGVTSFDRSNRTPDTTYTYRVRAHNAFGYSSYSNETSQTTPIPLPNPPGNVQITYLGITELDIAYTNDPMARQVNLWYSTNGGAYVNDYTSDLPGPPPTSLTSYGLTAGTTYCYKLRYRNTQGFSQFAAPVCATTYSTTPPVAPSNVQISLFSSTVALLTFDHPLTNIWGFSLSYSFDNAQWTDNWVTVNTKKVYITNLAAGTTYYFRVRAYVMSNSSNFLYSAFTNSVNVTTPGGAPPAGLTTFTNTASYPIISLKIDNVQKIQPGGAIPLGATFKLDLAAGTHTYAYTLGFLNGATPFGMYDFTGSFSAGSTVNLRNATLGEILTQGGSYGYWVGEYWQNLVPGSMGFCFNKSGGYTFYVNGMPRSLGSAVMTYQPNPGSFIINFSVASGPNYTATMNELEATFMMKNGPTDWPLVEYIFDGNTCP